MRKSKWRLVVDTNIWISFLISKNFPELLRLIETQKVVLLFSNELLEELLAVAERPKMRRYFPFENSYNLLGLFDVYGEFIEVKSKTSFSTDKADNFLIDLAVDGRADYLITGDAALLNVMTVKKTRIVKYSDFLKCIKYER
ncbi:MAG TPA: putative toxin-antitoxin system toxin component, PIN family [Chitinophagales bacterium]|nr:putative toxin-antitoxin system toxin component, PIN family [Chitinophagales bacterium]